MKSVFDCENKVSTIFVCTLDAAKINGVLFNGIIQFQKYQTVSLFSYAIFFSQKVSINNKIFIYRKYGLEKYDL